MTKGKLFFLIFILGIIAILAYIKHTKNVEAKAKEMPKDAKGKGGAKTLTASGFVVEYSKLVNDLSANGTILASDEVSLQPEVSGRVVFLRINEGETVSKGTLLMKINDADLKAQVQKSKAQLKIAQTNLKRLAVLLKINGVAQAEYDAADNQVNNIIADIELLQVQIAKTELRAPFTGKLGLRNISLGAYVTPQTIVASLQNISQLKMDVTLPERYAITIHTGDVMECTVAGIEKPFLAKAYAIEPQIDEATRNLKIRAILLNPSKLLLPGAYVKVALKLKDTPNAIMIPSNTLIMDDKSTKIVIADSSKAKFIDVEIGVRTASDVQILSGLHPGDTVLTSGLLQVKPGMPVKISKTTSKSTVQ